MTNDVCGAVVNIRNKGDKLAIWTQDATRTEATVRIGSVEFTCRYLTCKLAVVEWVLAVDHVWLYKDKTAGAAAVLTTHCLAC